MVPLMLLPKPLFLLLKEKLKPNKSNLIYDLHEHLITDEETVGATGGHHGEFEFGEVFVH